jgi:hypothetical protein
MSQAVVTITSAPRGLPGQPAVTFVPAQVVCTWSWGLQPATALIDWVSASAQPSVVSGASLQIAVGGHTFYGFTDNVVLRVATDGFSLMQEFKDNRDYLQWDMVYGAFNAQDNRIVGGEYIKRYKHLLPANFDAGEWTYTNAPYQANQILDFLFGAATVQSPWSRSYDEVMYEPVFDLDYTSGVKLGSAVVDISEQLGCVFTLMGGPYSLVWTVKGVGTLPGFPANSDNRRVGTAISGNATRLRVLGDRNQYEVLNIPMVPDWLTPWQAFYDFGAFVNDIFQNEATDALLAGIPAGTPYLAIPGDTDQVIGFSLAGARARQLTVAQYADLRDARSGDGEAFRDYRRFQGRSRLNLPAALYIKTIVLRAFRLPDTFLLRLANGLLADKYAINLDDTSVVEVTHDPVTGVMSALRSGGQYEVPSSEHNGYAIVQGEQVAQDAFKTLHPDYFDLNNWIGAQQLWAAAAFQIDDSGEGDQFILFDDPVIASGNLISQIVIAGQPQTYPDGRPRVALSAQATVAPAAVQVALTFRGEKFSWVQGSGSRDDVVNIANLNGVFLTGFGSPSYSGGYTISAPLVELPFADGLTASQKASQYVNTLLNGQWYYQSGGYTVQGSNATQLGAVIDRVTIRWDAQDGLTEEVDYTNERSRNVSIGPNGAAVLMLEPEREFDRRSQLAALFAGQDELRQAANQLKLSAVLLKANPQILHDLVQTYHLLLGLDTPPFTGLITGGPTGSLPALAVGTPLFRNTAANVAAVPNGGTALTNPVFMGVTLMDGEATNGGVRMTATGSGGIVQVRVLVASALAAGTAVGLGTDKQPHDYLVSSPGLAVGTLVDDFSGLTGAALGKVYFCRVRVTGGSGGTTTTVSNWNYRGLWTATPTSAYMTGDVVQLGSGTASGNYFSTIDNNANSPDTGIGWIQVSSSSGAWL